MRTKAADSTSGTEESEGEVTRVMKSILANESLDDSVPGSIIVERNISELATQLRRPGGKIDDDILFAFKESVERDIYDLKSRLELQSEVIEALKIGNDDKLCSSGTPYGTCVSVQSIISKLADERAINKKLQEEKRALVVEVRSQYRGLATLNKKVEAIEKNTTILEAKIKEKNACIERQRIELANQTEKINGRRDSMRRQNKILKANSQKQENAIAQLRAKHKKQENTIAQLKSNLKHQDMIISQQREKLYPGNMMGYALPNMIEQFKRSMFSGRPGLSRGELTRHANDLRQKWMQHRNEREILTFIRREVKYTLGAGRIIVENNVDYAISCKSSEELKLTIELVVVLYHNDVVTKSNIETAMSEIVEFINHFACKNSEIFDQAGKMLCAFLTADVLTIKWLCQCLGRVDDGRCKLKVIQYTMKSIRKASGSKSIESCAMLRELENTLLDIDII